MSSELPEKYIIRTSDRLNFKRCRRAWDFSSKIRQNYEPKRNARPLSFGTAVHAGLEAYYEPKTWHDKEIKEASCILAFQESVNKTRAEYLERTDKADLDPVEQEEFDEDWELGLAILNNYFKWAPTEDNFTPVFVEIEFEVPILVPDTFIQMDLPLGFTIDPEPGALLLHNRPVVYQGRLDMLLKDKWDKYWILDHKTAAAFKTTEWLDFDEQCGSYCWAVQHMLGIKVSGVIYSELKKALAHKPKVLKNGTLSVAKNQNTTYDLYLEAITENNLDPTPYADMLTFLEDQGEKYFRRTEVKRNQVELANLGTQIFYEAIEMLNDPVIYPTGGQNCNWCDFRGPCLATNDGSDATWMLQDLYRKRSSSDAEVVVEENTKPMNAF